MQDTATKMAVIDRKSHRYLNLLDMAYQFIHPVLPRKQTLFFFIAPPRRLRTGNRLVDYSTI